MLNLICKGAERNTNEKVPAKVTIDLKTGISSTEYIELTHEEYDERVITPLARIFYEQMKRDIKWCKFIPDEYSDKPTPK